MEIFKNKDVAIIVQCLKVDGIIEEDCINVEFLNVTSVDIDAPNDGWLSQGKAGGNGHYYSDYYVNMPEDLSKWTIVATRHDGTEFTVSRDGDEFICTTGGG